MLATAAATRSARAVPPARPTSPLSIAFFKPAPRAKHAVLVARRQRLDFGVVDFEPDAVKR
jgi:hypothetical protein